MYMDVENIFYQNPTFVDSIYRHIRQNTFIDITILKRCSKIHIPEYYIDSNTSAYINHSVNHFIWLHMLQHTNKQYIKTKDCIRNDHDMPKMLLYGHNYSPEKTFKDMESVDRMVNIIKWVLTYPY